MKPTKPEIAAAVGSLGGVVKFFPTSDSDRKEIMKFVERLVGTKKQLDWLIETVINNCDEWPGAKELRGIFCTRFKPADGIEGDSAISGFTPDDGERKFAEQTTKALNGSEQKLLTGTVSPEELAASDESRASTVQLAREVKSIKPAKSIDPPEWLTSLVQIDRRRAS
jgi:hypothetical protein